MNSGISFFFNIQEDFFEYIPHLSFWNCEDLVYFSQILPAVSLLQREAACAALHIFNEIYNNCPPIRLSACLKCKYVLVSDML